MSSGRSKGGGREGRLSSRGRTQSTSESGVSCSAAEERRVWTSGSLWDALAACRGVFMFWRNSRTRRRSSPSLLPPSITPLSSHPSPHPRLSHSQRRSRRSASILMVKEEAADADAKDKKRKAARGDLQPSFPSPPSRKLTPAFTCLSSLPVVSER